MRAQLAYCSACDRDVQIVITDPPLEDGHANLHDAEVVCLEIGQRCSGNLCPVGAMPPAVMAARLVHNGLQTTNHPLASMTCERCDHVTTHVVIQHRYATCTDCGATVEGSFEQAE